MKKIVYILFFSISSHINAQDIFSLSKLTDHVKGVVFTVRNGYTSSGGNDSKYFRGYGFSLLIRPDNISPGSGYTGDDADTTIEPSVTIKPPCQKDTCWKIKREIQNPFTLVLGYEFTPDYPYKIDGRESSIPIKGYYAGVFWHVPKTTGWLGATAQLCSISDASGIVRDTIPIKYSSETILAPEVYIGCSLAKKGTLRFIFVDLSYQYLHFSSVSYKSSADGSYVSTIKNPGLSSDITINSLILTIGVSVSGFIFK